MLFSVGLILGRFFSLLVFFFFRLQPWYQGLISQGAYSLLSLGRDVCQVHCGIFGGTGFQQCRISGSLRCFTALVQIFRVSGNSPLQRHHSFHLGLNRSSPSFHSVPKFLATQLKQHYFHKKDYTQTYTELTGVNNSFIFKRVHL